MLPHTRGIAIATARRMDKRYAPVLVVAGFWGLCQVARFSLVLRKLGTRGPLVEPLARRLLWTISRSTGADGYGSGG